MSDNDDFLGEYITEAREHLANAEEQLLANSDGDVDIDSMDSCFRSLHTVKGGAGFLDLQRIVGVAHVAEQLLEELKNGNINCTPEHIDMLLTAVSHLHELTADESIIQGEALTEKDNAIVKSLEFMLNPGGVASAGTDSDTVDNSETQDDDVDVSMLADELNTLCHLEDGDVPTLIRVIEALDSISKHSDWCNDSHDTLHNIQQQCDDSMFADAEGQAECFANIRDLGQQLREMINAVSSSQQSKRSREQLLETLIQSESGDIPEIIRVSSELEAHLSTFNDTEQALFKQIQEICDNIMFADESEQSRGFNTIHQHAEDLLKSIANASNSESFVNLATDFIPETTEVLSALEDIVINNQQPNQQHIDELLRGYHTIKGIASYIGLQSISQLIHHFENALSDLKTKLDMWDQIYKELILECIDVIRSLCKHIAREGSDAGHWPDNALSFCLKIQAMDLHKLHGQGATLVSNDSDFNAIAPTDTDRVPRIGDLLVAKGVDRELVEKSEQERKPGQTIGDSLVEHGAASKQEIEKAAKQQQEIKTKVKSENTTRVNTDRLDELINLVGELIISEAMVNQKIESYNDQSLNQTANSMHRIVRDLQSLSMSLRMVPLKTTFRKMARAVHDTARKVNKKIKFNLVGEETEIDRILAEKIADPLLHMVRNAADHGIEDNEGRAKVGKSEQGTITLSASQTSEHVVISLQDDGKGMDPEVLREKAIEKGLIDSNTKLTKQECFFLVFKAGFSTAAQLTGISGRGVGMDVVRRNIHDMNGIIEIDSELGKGTTFTLRLPLTTAILDAMLIRCGHQRFLLPITAIVEANRPQAGDIEHVLHKGRIYKSRGQLLPLITLGQEFNTYNYIEDPEEAIVIVVECYNGAYALQVDEILGQQQVVIKPLNQHFDYHNGLAGSAILGDGQVGLIIDPNRITHNKESNAVEASSEAL